MEYFNTSFDGFSFEMVKNGCPSPSLVLDNERGELVKALVKPPGQKVANAEKAMIAMRNHSEAERRRRERINGHLATLRTLIPGTNKMDKAALLGEAINQVKLLRQSAAEASNGPELIPSDIDEVKVDQVQEDGTWISIKASLCCDFKHEIITDLREALSSLSLKMVKAEIASLGSRMVTVFVFCGDGEDGVADVRRALSSVLDKFYASEEFSTSSKRRRASLFASNSSSSSSSLTDHIWY